MKTITQLFKAVIILLMFTGITSPAMAQESIPATPQDKAALLAKKTANPIAALISVPVQFNFNFGLGEYNRFQLVTNLMPVLPFRLNDKINVVNRIIVPFIYQPDVSKESGGQFGVGDINYSMFFTSARTQKIIWGIGPAFNIPTRTNDMLGSPEFGLGPTFIALMMPGNWAIGFTVNNVWSYNTGNLNALFGQVFIVYTFPSAWFVQFMPTITANWNAPEGQQWTVPLGANAGKVVMFGKQPVKFIAGGGYFVAKPDNGPDWQIFAQAVFLFPKKKK